MSVAPASLRAGSNTLISVLLITVSMANPLSPESWDTVGAFIDGSSFKTASRSLADTFSFTSTLPRASSAP